MPNERTRRARRGLTLAVLVATAASTSVARADEPRQANEPATLAEPGEVTDVIDAFDGDDAFDLHFTLGFQQSWKSAKIRRETYIGDASNPGLSTGGYTAATMNVASYEERTSRLNLRADFGIYKDIAVYLRMPIVLSNTRSLGGLAGSDSPSVMPYTLGGGPGEQLFSLPFKSPQRSGIEYLALGVDFSIMNQMRDATKPTWVFGLEGRFSVSEPMHACNDAPTSGQVGCAYPSDINRNGVSDGNDVLAAAGAIGDVPSNVGKLEGSFSGQRSPGISRGTTALEAHTMMSKRIRYVEPYGGFRAIFEFPTASSDFGATDLRGSIVNHPPMQGFIILGTQVIPWENREQFQRVSFDFRFTGSYRSEGRDYSELFDALGSSSAGSLRRPNFADYRANPSYDPTCVPGGGRVCEPASIVNPASQKVYFTGITDVQAFGTFNLSTSVTWQAAQYIKFQLGGGFTHEQSHYVASDQACNPDFAQSDRGQSGPCHTDTALKVGNTPVTGVPNPNYRPTINVPGRRFKVDDINLWDAWINAIVMF